MTNNPTFPKELQPALDAALHGFQEGKVNPDILKPIYEWLEVDGWEALINDLGEQMALNLGYLAQFQFSDSELRACMDIPDEQPLTDEDRIRWGRSHIDRVLNGDDEYRSLPVALFSARNIVKNSLKIQYTCPLIACHRVVTQIN